LASISATSFKIKQLSFLTNFAPLSIIPSESSTIIQEDFPHLGSGWNSGSPAPPAGISSLYGAGVPKNSPLPIQPHQYKLPYAQQQFSASVFQNKQYANFLRENNVLDNGFHIQSNEDFPALPASSNNSTPYGGQQNSKILADMEMTNDCNMRVEQLATESSIPILSSNISEIKPKPGIQTHPDGRVTNIPAGMLNDQYGMAGLLTFLRTLESEPSIVALALGSDLTNLGLNLNSSKRNLYQTFGGPWADSPCRIQDLDAKVPEEYLTNATIREKLPHIKLNKLQDDVLFYLFYNCPGEVYQVAAAAELFQRDWRFHKTERVWITRAPFSNPPREHTGNYEKCSYHVFDPTQWKKVPRELLLEYKELEGRPTPLATNPSAMDVGHASSNIEERQ